MRSAAIVSVSEMCLNTTARIMYCRVWRHPYADTGRRYFMYERRRGFVVNRFIIWRACIAGNRCQFMYIPTVPTPM